jgi:hypothetical protein
MSQKTPIPYDDSNDEKERWLEARRQGKVKRRFVTDAIQEAILGSDRKGKPRPQPDSFAYAYATNELYKGLCDHTAKQIRAIIGAPEGKPLRDCFDKTALHTIAAAEASAAEAMFANDELDYEYCISVISQVTLSLKPFIRMHARLTGKDMFTKKPVGSDNKPITS